MEWIYMREEVRMGIWLNWLRILSSGEHLREMQVALFDRLYTLIGGNTRYIQKNMQFQGLSRKLSTYTHDRKQYTRQSRSPP
jgi:hypothetical protein